MTGKRTSPWAWAALAGGITLAGAAIQPTHARSTYAQSTYAQPSLALSGKVVAVSALAEMASTAAATYDTLVGADGSIKFPSGFRSNGKWTHIGSWAVVNEGGEGNGLHDVYTTKDVVDAYQKSGSFPDGAVLVKEVRASATEQMTTGQAYWATDNQVWFVMVKDRTNRFPGNALWGNGWGWALSKADNPTAQVATNYKTDCLGCHVPAQESDWVYTKAYPALRGE